MFLSYLLSFFLSLPFVTNWCLHKTTGFAANISTIEYSPDRSLFITTNDQGDAHLWSATNFLIVKSISPVSGSATSARFNKNNTLFGVSTSTSTVYIYNMTSPYTQITTYSPGIGAASTAIDFSYDGQFLLICGGTTNTAKIINLLTGAVSSTFTFSGAKTCKFARNSNIGIAGTTLGYHLIAGTSVWSQPHSGCLQLNFDDTSSYMVMSCNNGGSKVGYMIETATQLLTTAYSSSNLMRTAQISPNSQYVVFSGDDKKVIIKKKNGASLQHTYNFTIESEAYSSDFSSDSNYFLIGTKAGYIYEYSKYCLDCQAGAYQNLTTLKCQNCSQYMRACGICINSTYCIQCNQGYYLEEITVSFTTNRVCKPCLLEGCIVCTNSITCIRCQVGYYVNAGLCKVCTSGGTGMVGCLRCNSSSICEQCSHDYYLSSNKCNLCNSIVGCSLCSSSAYCHVCQVGYYFNSGVCTACPTNCLACYNTTTCQDCRQGYYPTNTVAAACSRCPTTGCLSCNETGYCLQCISGRYYDTATGTCPTCSYPCNQCNYTICLNCQPGFYLDYVALNFTTSSSGGLCVQCNHPCVTCSNTTACLTCPIGYYLISVTKICQTCQILQSFCSQCTSTTCLNCTLGYYLNSTNLCTPCTNNMYACISCTNISTCVQCAVGFYLTASSGNNSCASCPEGCQLCTSTSYCYGCIDGFYRDVNTCKRCVSPCTMCSSSSICIQCEQQYYLSGTTCTGCIQNITNCLTCDDQSGIVKCTSCKATYYLNLGACLPCPAPCLTCLSSSTCTQCDIGFYIVGATCNQCPQNCSACSSSTNCSSCNIGFYFNSTDRKCYHCTNLGCLTCNSSYSCLSCSPGSYLTVNNTCSLCHSSMKYCEKCLSSSSCQSCSFGYVLNSNSSGCIVCSTINGCFDCSSITSCEACQPGYYLYNNSGSVICSLCPPTCLTCTSSSNCLTCLPGYQIQGTSCSSCQQVYIGCEICNGTKCQQCMNGYYLNPSGFCSLCRSSMKGCQYCNSSSVCTYCGLGFYLQAGNTCQLCSVPMLACQVCSSSSVCVECESGYYLQSGNCILCRSSMPGCLRCLNNHTCLQCLQGYSLNSTSLECSLCKNSIAGCISCLSLSTCQQCEAGYYLRSLDSNCMPCNQTGCQICFQSNPNTCLSCNTMYFLSSLKCYYCGQYIQGCIQCLSNSVCTLCETGYFLNSTNKCQLCQTNMEGCSKCHNSLACYQCKSTYFINTTSSKCQTCLSAILGCAYCLDLSQCISCSSGFYKNSSGFCEICTKITGCLACKDSNTCLLCSADHYLESGKCYPCETIEGCYSCTNNVTCLVCSGGYILNDDKICEIYQAQADSNIKGMKMVSQYVNQTSLRHILYANQMKYKEDNFSLITWRDTTNIMLQHPNFFMENLTIQEAKFEQSNQLVFYTNNPLNVSMATLPARRMLSAMPDGYKTFLKMKQEMINIILPDLYMSHTLVMDYQLTQPQFYISITSKKFNLFQTIFGIIIILLLTLNYIIRAVLTCPNQALSQYGQILPHFSSLKAPVFIIHPLFPEEISFCLGFMTAQLPWLRQFFSQLVSDKSQTIPVQYSVLYPSMGFSSTYLLPLIVGFVLLIIMWLYKKSVNNKQKEKSKNLSQKQDDIAENQKEPNWGLPEWPLKMVFYNFFFFGLCFNGSASLQNAIYNPISELTISSFLCVVGIVCFVFCAVDSIYSIYRNQILFFKIRIFSKAVFLSLCHISPIYLYSSSFLLDIVFMVLEYRISKSYKSHPRLWLYNNIMINISLALLVFIHSHMITIIISGAILATIITLQIYVHYQDYLTQKKRSRFMLPKEFKLNSNEQQIDHQKTKANVWDMEFSKEKEDINKVKGKQCSSRQPNLEENKSKQIQIDAHAHKKQKRRKEKKIPDSLRVNYQNQSESNINTVDYENKAETFLAADFIN